MFKSAQRGFTLIELVVVIVILGILAAFAVPRFARLDQQARVSSVRSLEGTLRSSAAMAHGQWLAQGRTGNVNMEGGGNLTFANDYPNASTIQRAIAQGTIGTGAGQFTATVSGNFVDFTLNGAFNPTNCRVRYTQATGANTAPNIATVAINTMQGNNGC